MTDLASVVLLAHNEAATIQREIAAFHETVIRHLPHAEFIIAEDGSADGTRALIEEIQPRYGFRITGAPERLGYARAVRNAVAASHGAFLFICDAGEKHDPADFWRLWERRHDADVVIGRKTNRTDQWYRQLMTFALNVYIRALFGIDALDSDSGMRLYNRRVADDVFNDALFFRGFISTEIVLRAAAKGLRFLEVPVSYRQREGESRGLPVRSMPRAIRRLLADSWRLKRELGGRL
ncbi:MAG: glycosyltransferase family 2 protein [Acidobacteria bacterium]|nr:glycosyltransferase family 2 protein [Acidobacteriota bacterium]MBV9478932.1 glycosyltransferase family 2 protein [Acidobacteriota bacterium]